MFKNPIIPGFYPDPSIIRVQDDFYIINSSFEYFPAIPIWHSKDLIHWRQIGNAVTKEEQGLDLSNVECSQGVQAATIRYHKGRYYITSTRVQNKWPSDNYHFIMYADDILGPWSEVIYLKNAYGIDSSLFFDDDKAYFIANRQKLDTDDGGDTEIWIQEIDLTTFELVGDKYSLWDGTGGLFPEGPHIYKRNGYYYLLIAEGGTLHNHTVTIARSSNVFGPYESSVRNPILTHKHLDRTYPIQNVGHADIVELEDGSFWGVCLGSRPKGGFYDGGNMKYTYGGYYRNLGRETYLFPVTWPNDNVSPLFSPLTGKIELEYPTPNLEIHYQEDIPISFRPESLHVKWCVIKKENKDHIEFNKNTLHLTLQDSVESSFIGFRQTSWYADMSVFVNLNSIQKQDTFSVMSYMTYQSNLQVRLSSDKIEFVSTYYGNETLLKEVPNSFKEVMVKINMDEQDYTYQVWDEQHNLIAEYTFDGRVISSDLNDTHTGAMIGFSGVSKHKTNITLSQLQYNESKTK